MTHCTRGNCVNLAGSEHILPLIITTRSFRYALLSSFFFLCVSLACTRRAGKDSTQVCLLALDIHHQQRKNIHAERVGSEVPFSSASSAFYFAVKKRKSTPLRAVYFYACAFFLLLASSRCVAHRWASAHP